MTNTGKLVRVVSDSSKVHSRDMSYTIPAGVYHSSEVLPDGLHATLFLFDAHRGFQQSSPALDPVDGSIYTVPRESADRTTTQLAQTVDCLRQWELLYAQGKLHVRNAELEEGLWAFRRAERLCLSFAEDLGSPFEHAPRYKWAGHGEIGHIYRMLGRNVDAIEILDTAIKQMPPSLQRVELVGELSVAYRHMNLLEASRDCCEDAYNTAKQLLSPEVTPSLAQRLKLEKEMCRAIGNWGMFTYQLFLDTRNPELLDLAMKQLSERIEIARRLKKVPELQSNFAEPLYFPRFSISSRQVVVL
jgi:tetratricopeptide (TPR) repeat protein